VGWKTEQQNTLGSLFVWFVDRYCALL
jgi:hypothetical protein